MACVSSRVEARRNILGLKGTMRILRPCVNREENRKNRKKKLKKQKKKHKNSGKTLTKSIMRTIIIYMMRAERNYSAKRDAILKDTDLKKRVNDATADMIAAAIENYASSSKKDPQDAAGELLDFLKQKFNYAPHLDDRRDPGALEKLFTAGLEKDIADKEELLGSEAINAFIRAQYLQFIDRYWLDHLENMEALREAVYLRGYAQKNPLT